MTTTTKTTIATATLFGSDGPYLVGYEYTEDADRVLHAVLRPERQEVHLGFALQADGTGTSVTRITHDGPMTAWRSFRGEVPRPCAGWERDANASQRSEVARRLPDEEHGWTWGDPIEIPSAEAARYYTFAAGPGPAEVSESEAETLMRDYDRSRHPDADRSEPATPEASLPIVQVAQCAIAQSTIMVTEPIRCSSSETEFVVVLTGAMGTHYMVWRESPAAWDGPPATSIRHLPVGHESQASREILAAAGAPALLDPIALVRLLDESAGPILGVHTMGRLTEELQRTIITACRAALTQRAMSDTAPA